MSNIFQRNYDRSKASRAYYREKGMHLEAAMFTRAMRYGAQEFESDVTVAQGDLEETELEKQAVADFDALPSEPAPPQDYTLRNKVDECLEKLYQAYNSDTQGSELVDLMKAYDAWLQ